MIRWAWFFCIGHEGGVDGRGKCVRLCLGRWWDGRVVWLGELMLDDAREDGCMVARAWFFFILFIWVSHLGLGTMLALAVCIHAFLGPSLAFSVQAGNVCVLVWPLCGRGDGDGHVSCIH